MHFSSNILNMSRKLLTRKAISSLDQASCSVSKLDLQNSVMSDINPREEISFVLLNSLYNENSDIRFCFGVLYFDNLKYLDVITFVIDAIDLFHGI